MGFRRPGEDIEAVCPWDRVDADALGMALPWRTFRWHHGQRHYPGSYWSATERDLVIYESRLELTRLLYAPPVESENVRFLAGFRRDWLFDPAASSPVDRPPST